MSQYATGTVSVTNGSQVVTGSGTLFSSNVAAGELFFRPGSGVGYPIGSVDNDGQITLRDNYAGATAVGVSYRIQTSRTPNRSLPYPEAGDGDQHTIIKEAMLKLDTLLGAAFPANRVLYADASGNLTTSANLTFNGSALALSGTLGVTKATAGDVITFTNAAAGNKTGYLYSDANVVGFTFAAGGSQAALFLSGTNSILYGPGQTASVAVSSTGAAVTGTLSASYGTAGSEAASFLHSHASNPYGVVVRYTGAAPNDTTHPFLTCYDTGVLERLTVRSNGGIANYQANDVNLSDARLKRDFQPAESYWEEWKAIDWGTYQIRDQTHSDPNFGYTALGVR